MLYKIEHSRQSDGIDLLQVGFDEPATNDRIVCEAADKIRALELDGGDGIRINGPASLPVAMTIAHAVGHIYGWVACYDPKLRGYVVAISHDPNVQVGETIPLPDTD